MTDIDPDITLVRHDLTAELPRPLQPYCPLGGHQHYHRPLSWYFDLLTRNGFVVTGRHEPPTLPHHTDPESEWTDHERWFATIPTMLAVSCRPAR